MWIIASGTTGLRQFLQSRVNVFFALWGLVLVLGCGMMPFSIIPVHELDEGRLSPLHFAKNHHPYFQGEIVFSHEVHEFVECSTCHGDSTTREEVEAGDLPPMKTCFGCHDGVQVTQACETCHQVNRKERKPRFHTGRWTTHHKEMAYKESYKCDVCHLENECQQCHSTWKPQSHTLRFNRSTHGRLAIRDRRACATCHETDFCENCHRQPPPDHTPSFLQGGHKQTARVKLRACLTCHSFQQTCSACHN